MVNPPKCRLRISFARSMASVSASAPPGGTGKDETCPCAVFSETRTLFEAVRAGRRQIFRAASTTQRMRSSGSSP